eukprot:4803970-Pleurochrysis_carterae.AAC.1
MRAPARHRTRDDGLHLLRQEKGGSRSHAPFVDCLSRIGDLSSLVSPFPPHASPPASLTCTPPRAHARTPARARPYARTHVRARVGA